MKVLGLCGGSGAGKTTLAEALIRGLRAGGESVCVIKHAHHGFEPDTPGKDSWRHRQAGAQAVLAVSERRMALFRDFDPPRPAFDLDLLLAELGSAASPDGWVLVEGFKHADLPKLEVWRSDLGKPAYYPQDPQVIAIATDDPAGLPTPTLLPVFHRDATPALIDFLRSQAGRLQRSS